MANYVLKKLRFGQDDTTDTETSGSDSSSVDWGAVLQTGIQTAGAISTAAIAATRPVVAPTPVVTAAPIVARPPAVGVSASSSGLLIVGGLALVLFLVLKK